MQKKSKHFRTDKEFLFSSVCVDVLKINIFPVKYLSVDFIENVFDVIRKMFFRSIWFKTSLNVYKFLLFFQFPVVILIDMCYCVFGSYILFSSIALYRKKDCKPTFFGGFVVFLELILQFFKKIKKRYWQKRRSVVR